MKNRYFLVLIVILILSVVIACNTSSESGIYLPKDGQTLLLQPEQVPSQWEFNEV